MDPQPTIQDLQTDVAAKAQAITDAQAAHAEAQAKLAAATAVSEPTGGVEVNEVVPAPAPTPAVPQLVKFAEPMHLVTTDDPTSTFDPISGAVVGSLPVNTSFEAIGKYEGASNVYFSDGTDAVRTVDLTSAPAVPATAASDDGAEKIEVHVTPATPPSPDAWKAMSKKFMNPLLFRIKGSFTVHDLAGVAPDIEVTPETHSEGKDGLEIGGTFTGPDGIEYCRPETSIDKGTWYGFPKETLQPVGDPEDDLSQDELDDIFNPQQAKATEVAAGYGKHKVAAAAGTSVGLFNRFKGKK